MSKSSMMYIPDGTARLAPSSNKLDMEHFGDVGSLDDNVESFLSHDDGDARDIFGTLKRSPTEHNTESSKGFSFSELGCIRTSNNKVVCFHFSSDGKLLASAGHEKKVMQGSYLISTFCCWNCGQEKLHCLTYWLVRDALGALRRTVIWLLGKTLSFFLLSCVTIMLFISLKKKKKAL
ncbi:transcriptional corepressor LEUNIG_HOMOLOG-like [Magnolia sinica]|uniref:transcriptional corepressor LEUNIG_HOMOLOG-like n=1 Tax=Magnolia sinica TaxID=86752 RepID=UPI0026594AAD|nr:transcriptional corepressor LEUNIG_HOMOLOG-like [Magnolia sinica]